MNTRAALILGVVLIAFFFVAVILTLSAITWQNEYDASMDEARTFLDQVMCG